MCDARAAAERAPHDRGDSRQFRGQLDETMHSVYQYDSRFYVESMFLISVASSREENETARGADGTLQPPTKTAWSSAIFQWARWVRR